MRPARLPLPDINNAALFLGASALLLAYIAYTLFRKRKGERPGFEHQEPEL